MQRKNNSRKLVPANISTPKVSILKNRVSIVAADMCLPEATRNVFQNFTISLQEANILWEKLRQITQEFNRNVEKFYAAFYGLLVENVFPLKFDIIIYQYFDESGADLDFLKPYSGVNERACGR